MSARPSRRLRQVYDGVVISLPFFSTADLVTLTEVCVPLRAALHENGEVADAAWASLTFFGPYPFGYRSCATGLAHSARMIVPVLLETLLRRHGLRVRTFTVTDCLFHDACLILVQRFCPNLLSLNLSQSEHRYQLNSPIFPSCLSSASLIGLKHCPSITSLQLRHTHVCPTPVTANLLSSSLLCGLAVSLLACHIPLFGILSLHL